MGADDVVNALHAVFLLIGAIGVFAFFFLSKTMKAKQTTMWISTLVAYAIQAFLIGLIAQDKGRSKRDDDNVVWDRVRYFSDLSITLYGLVAGVAFMGRVSNMIWPAVFTFLGHLAIVVGAHYGGFAHWYAWFVALVFAIAFAISLFFEGTGSKLEVTGASAGYKTSLIVVFKVLFIVHRSLYMLCYALDQPFGNVIDNVVVMDILFFVVAAISAIVVFLVLVLFNPDTNTYLTSIENQKDGFVRVQESVNGAPPQQQQQQQHNNYVQVANNIQHRTPTNNNNTTNSWNV